MYERILNWNTRKLSFSLTSRHIEMYGKGYGMPSSHAQFLAFFGLYLTLFLLLRHKPTTSSAPQPPFPLPSPKAQYSILSFLIIVGASLVALSRVYLSYHTPRQVLVGCSAGVISALVWFFVTGWARENGWVQWMLDFRTASILRLRDLVVEEDLVESGWREWERKRPRRRSIGDKKIS